MTDHPAPPPSPDPAEAVPDADYLHAFAPVPTRARRDGWTPDRQRAFIAALRQHGSVHKAARSIGMSHQSAWRLRARPQAEGFADAWQRAVDDASARALDEAFERARSGVMLARYYRGRYMGLSHRHDDRAMIAALRVHYARPPGR